MCTMLPFKMLYDIYGSVTCLIVPSLIVISLDACAPKLVVLGVRFALQRFVLVGLSCVPSDDLDVAGA